VKRGTGFSAYELLYGCKPVLPIDIEMLTYLAIDWWKVKSSADLVVARAEQLLRRESVISKAAARLKSSRAKSVRYWDEKCAHRLRESLRKGDLVLLYNRSLETQWGKLFANRWNGPYRMVSQFPGGSYQLEELDGSLLSRKAAASHLKRFYTRGATTFDETAASDSGHSGEDEITGEGPSIFPREDEVTGGDSGLLRIPREDEVTGSVDGEDGVAGSERRNLDADVSDDEELPSEAVDSRSAPLVRRSKRLNPAGDSVLRAGRKGPWAKS